MSTRMAVIENEVDIDRPVEEVFAYCSDHTNEREWNPKMRYVKKLTKGCVVRKCRDHRGANACVDDQGLASYSRRRADPMF